MASALKTFCDIFQSTLPVRGATKDKKRMTQEDRISIHAPRAGSDGAHRTRRKRKRNFNPRSPCGERHVCERRLVRWREDFNPRSPCGSDGTPFEAVNMLTGISIHAPRAGSDQVIRVYVQNATYFNPRSPCGERRCMRPACSVSSVFQSTLPVRGATMNNARSTAFSHDFNPRSPCGERPTPHTHGSRVKAFQSTLPVRGATRDYVAGGFKPLFQSTLPVRGATIGLSAIFVFGSISIHAPRAGSDSNILCFCKLKAQYILNQLF